MKGHHRPFLVLWTLAVAASVLAFVVHLGLRGKTMALAYELGQKRAEQARLREVRRVLELEVASYKTPQRVEMVARTVLGMEPPSPERIVAIEPAPRADAAPATSQAGRPAVAQRGVSPPPGGVVAPPAPTATELLAPRITPPKHAGPGEEPPP